MTPAGIILIDKPEGVTSFGALNPIKKALGKTVKVGHTGTLDKFASGLLVVCAGGYTRLASVITASDKTYEAVIRFGEETDTLDPSGEVTAQAPVPSRKAVMDVLPRFTGTILQRPPLFSALHIDGERAYRKALRGEDVRMPEREVTIRSLELLHFDGTFARVRVECSKGTYIRSLARDLALAAGSRARLEKLRRIKVGSFDVAGAVAPSSFDPGSHLLQGDEVFRALEDRFLTAVIDNATVSGVQNGSLPPTDFLESCFREQGPDQKKSLLLFCGEGRLAASVSRSAEGRFSFDFVVRK